MIDVATKEKASKGSLLAAAIAAGRPVKRLGSLKTSRLPAASAYFEAMAEASRKAFSKPFFVGDSNK